MTSPLVGRDAELVEGNGSYRAVARALAGLLVPNEVPHELRPYRAALGRIVPMWTAPDAELSVDPAVLLGEGLVRLLDRSVLILDDLQWADRRPCPWSPTSPRPPVLAACWSRPPSAPTSRRRR